MFALDLFVTVGSHLLPPTSLPNYVLLWFLPFLSFFVQCSFLSFVLFSSTLLTSKCNLCTFLPSSLTRNGDTGMNTRAAQRYSDKDPTISPHLFVEKIRFTRMWINIVGCFLCWSKIHNRYIYILQCTFQCPNRFIQWGGCKINLLSLPFVADGSTSILTIHLSPLLSAVFSVAKIKGHGRNKGETGEK